MEIVAPTDEQLEVYHNQTAILSWLRRRGHAVDFVRDPAVPNIHLPSRFNYVGQPCPYCGRLMTRSGERRVTREHIVPASKGGVLSFSNRLIVCAPCNFDKKDLLLSEWLRRLKHGGDPRAFHVQHVLEKETRR